MLPKTNFISQEISNRQVASKKLRKCWAQIQSLTAFNKTSKCSSGEFCIKKPRFISSRFSSRSLIIPAGQPRPQGKSPGDEVACRCVVSKFTFSLTTIGNISASFKCIVSYCCSRENETWKRLPLGLTC